MIHWKHMIAAGALLTSTIAIAATINGTAGNDDLVGTQQGDEIRGEAGNDHLLGQGGNDNLHGGTGDDFLSGGTGYNSLAGNAGRDIFNVALATTTWIADLEAGEHVQISCAANWGGTQKNYDTLLNYGHDTPNGELTFLGRDGTKVIFKGLTYAQALAAVKYPIIERITVC